VSAYESDVESDENDSNDGEETVSNKNKSSPSQRSSSDDEAVGGRQDEDSKRSRDNSADSSSIIDVDDNDKKASRRDHESDNDDYSTSIKNLRNQADYNEITNAVIESKEEIYVSNESSTTSLVSNQRISNIIDGSENINENVILNPQYSKY
jgi:hypothetical protein